jgi:hypothetical protein
MQYFTTAGESLTLRLSYDNRSGLQCCSSRARIRESRPKRDLYEERVFRDQVLEWVTSKPTQFLKNVTSNIWGYWVRAENLRKTLLMLSMQAVFLGAALLGLG